MGHQRLQLVLFRHFRVGSRPDSYPPTRIRPLYGTRRASPLETSLPASPAPAQPTQSLPQQDLAREPRRRRQEIPWRMSGPAIFGLGSVSHLQLVHLRRQRRPCQRKTLPRRGDATTAGPACLVVPVPGDLVPRLAAGLLHVPPYGRGVLYNPVVSSPHARRRPRRCVAVCAQAS